MEDRDGIADIVYLGGQYFVVLDIAGHHRRIPCRNKLHADQVLAEQRALYAMPAKVQDALERPDS